MNGVIHQCSHSSDEKLISTRDESEIYLSIFAYVQALFDKIRPRKLFFLAVDGVAPRAKMNQQRSRRFRTAAEKAEAEAKEMIKEKQKSGSGGNVTILNDPAVVSASSSSTSSSTKYFDTNCITPGTEFMERLSTHLCYLISKRIDEDASWRGCKIIFSGPEVPGEGEHKVMEWIRADRAKPDHEANLRHCLYGLDADLIMLGLLSHEPHFALLREEVTFGRKQQQKSSNQSVRFHLMHLGLMRNYMELEFGLIKKELKFAFDFERILDDFVLLSLFVGNDFIPHLPHLHINENALGLLFEAYKTTLPHLDGYLNDCGQVNLKRCGRVLEKVVEFERKVFESDCADQLEDLCLLNATDDIGNNKSGNNKTKSTSSLPPISTKQRAIFDEFVRGFLKRDDVLFWECDADLIANHPEDRIFVAGLAKDFMLILELTEDHSFVIRKCFEEDVGEVLDLSLQPTSVKEYENGYEGWKFNLDTAKIVSKYEKRPITSELDPEVILKNEQSVWTQWKSDYYAEKMEIRGVEGKRNLLQKYCEGLKWVMAYYYEGVASWSWFFPYHYAPFLTDLVEFLLCEPSQSGGFKEITFDLGRPFTPFEQLMGVLPSLSSALVPAPLAQLMTSPESQILHFFPTEFDCDLNGKKNSWEAVVKIPFIDETLLVETLNQKYCLLTDLELKRNQFGSAYTFQFLPGQSIQLHPPSASFDLIEECRVKMTIQPITKPSRDQLRKGLTPGLLIGLQGPPSFPSLKLLPLSSALQHLDIQVFQGQASKAMTLALIITDEHVQKYSASPASLFSSIQNVHIKWPHLLEAELVALTDGQRVYLADRPNSPLELTSELLKQYAGPGISDYGQLIESLETSYARKHGIILAGGISLVAILHPFRRLKMSQQDGAIVKEFDKSRVELVPLQLLILNLPRVDERFQSRPAFSADSSQIASSFSVGDEVIFIGPGDHFGQVAKVDGFVQDGKGLSIAIAAYSNSNYLDQNQSEIFKIVQNSNGRTSSTFINARDVGSILNLPPWLLSKLTSTLQIIHEGKSVVNVGFGVKFEGKSRAVPALARKISPGKWDYSKKLVDDLREYCAVFPKLISGLISAGPSADRPSMVGIASGEEIQKIRQWLKDHSYPGGDSAQPCDNVKILDSKGVSDLSTFVDQISLKGALKSGNDLIKLSPIKAEQLMTRQFAQLYCSMRWEESNKAGFDIGDRIIWAGDGADGIPFGTSGTIVAIFSNNENSSNPYKNNNNNYSNNSSSTITDAPVVWVLLDKNLRGIGCDLEGYLPNSFKARGLIGRIDKILNVTKWNTKKAKSKDNSIHSHSYPHHSTITPSYVTDKIKVTPAIKFSTATINENLVKKSVVTSAAASATKTKEVNVPPVQIKQNDPVALLDAIFKATSLKPKEEAIVYKDNHQHQKSQSSGEKQQEVRKFSTTTAIKSKPVVSKTVKISYSTSTKSKTASE